MPSLYHFNSDQFKENLILGGQQHMVAGRLCQYLKGWQLDGIRFLYKHFEKGESCIFNDESGLGKVVTTSLFLGAILSNDTTKKCLIIVRDDEYIEGWRFHLSVLTQLSVKVIERTSDINHETVFLIKWSTIKDIEQISKTTFDHIIVDNRGEMLTNKFCTGILLRYFESKISIVISSSDVTSDINLLHTILRLCGRLDRQYANIKSFEEKFQLPSLKEGVCNKIDLEDYFLKREKIINFCREFRLRRYRHQFEEQFPLVPCNDFKRYLQQWRNSSNSQSSGSAKLCSSSSEKDVEELFQVYFRVKQERDESKRECLVDMVNECIRCEDSDSNLSDELLVMSPLLVVSESESESEQIQLRSEPSTFVSDEIKEEEEQKDLQREKKTKEDRRKLSKPIKKSSELVNPKSLRSREVVGDADMLTKSSRKRGRPPGKKPIPHDKSVKHPRNESLGDGVTPKISAERLQKESHSSKRKIELGNELQEKTLNKIDLKSGKVEVKKKDTAADPSTIKTPGPKDDERLIKKNLLNAESAKKKADNSSSDGLKNNKEVEKSKNTCEKSPRLGKDEEVNKSVPKEQNSKTPEKKAVRKNDSDQVKKVPGKNVEVGKRNRSKLEDDDAFENAVKVKVKKNKVADGCNKTKHIKDEENQRRRAKIDSGKDQKISAQNAHIEPKKPARNVKLDLVIEEANKFLKIRNVPAVESAEECSRMTRRRFEKSPDKKSPRGSGGKSDKSPLNENSTRKAGGKPDMSPVDNKSASNSAGKLDKTPMNNRSSSKSDEKSDKLPVNNKSTSNSGGKLDKTCNNTSKSYSSNQSKQEKDRSDTPKRHKPLTVYTVLGVHGRSTRGMQRCTRSSAIQSKYMGVCEAQVGLDKLSKPRRQLTRHQSMTTETSKSSKKDSKLNDSTVPESSAILENMELGQALTPTNNCLATDLTAPIPKKVGYDFPLMLDKDIPDTECIITSQNSNKNEVIILTGSTTSDTESEVEPPKNSANHRMSSMRPPMVTIPRQSQGKAKSPDLFSTCSDISLPCSQQKNSKSTFDGFKIFGTEVRQHLASTLLDETNRVAQQRAGHLPLNNDSKPNKELQPSPTNHPIEDEDAMFEITSNGTFSNMIRVNSNGEMSPLRNNTQSTPPSASHRMNRITNYLISSNQQINGTSPSPSLDDQLESLQKTPKRRKSLSGTMKRSPRSGSNPLKTQSTKLTQWLIKNRPVVRISDKPLKACSTKRKRLDLLFPDDK